MDIYLETMPIPAQKVRFKYDTVPGIRRLAAVEFTTSPEVYIIAGTVRIGVICVLVFFREGAHFPDLSSTCAERCSRAGSYVSHEMS